MLTHTQQIDHMLFLMDVEMRWHEQWGPTSRDIRTYHTRLSELSGWTPGQRERLQQLKGRASLCRDRLRGVQNALTDFSTLTVDMEGDCKDSIEALGGKTE